MANCKKIVDTSSAAVDVVVVNYNAGPHLSECVSAVLASPAAANLIVSDNGSTDDSIDRLQVAWATDPRLSIQMNGTNLGFARACNKAASACQSPFILFLNPDCIPSEDSLSRLHEFMVSTPDAGMSGCVIRNPDGKEQVASRRVIPDPWIGLSRVLGIEKVVPYALGSKRLDLSNEPLPREPIRVEAISGALMFVRRSALESVGLLDEGYFLHCEDLDWFVRFKKAGWRIYLVPDVDALHYKGVCSATRPLAVLWHKHRGMTRFFRKFQFRDYPLLVSIFVVAGIWIHFFVVSSFLSLRVIAKRLLVR